MTQALCPPLSPGALAKHRAGTAQPAPAPPFDVEPKGGWGRALHAWVAWEGLLILQGAR